QGVSGTGMRLGVLRSQPQPDRGVVLDVGVRRSGQGTRVPGEAAAIPRARQRMRVARTHGYRAPRRCPEGLEPPAFGSVVGCGTAGTPAGARGRGQGSTGSPLTTPDPGAVPPVCETAVRDRQVEVRPMASNITVPPWEGQR